MVKVKGRNRALSGGEVAKKTSMHREENETEAKPRDGENADNMALPASSPCLRPVSRI